MADKLGHNGEKLAKLGMGVDEGYMIVFNEMNRILAIRNAKKNNK